MTISYQAGATTASQVLTAANATPGFNNLFVATLDESVETGNTGTGTFGATAATGSTSGGYVSYVPDGPNNDLKFMAVTAGDVATITIQPDASIVDGTPTATWTSATNSLVVKYQVHVTTASQIQTLLAATPGFKDKIKVDLDTGSEANDGSGPLGDSSGMILAARLDSKGLYRSYAGGAAAASWVLLSGKGGLPVGVVSDVIAVPNPSGAGDNPVELFAAVPGQGIYLSTDTGNTWTPSTTGLPNPNSVSTRILLASAGSGDNAVVYAAVAGYYYYQSNFSSAITVHGATMVTMASVDGVLTGDTLGANTSVNGRLVFQEKAIVKAVDTTTKTITFETPLANTYTTNDVLLNTGLGGRLIWMGQTALTGGWTSLAVPTTVDEGGRYGLFPGGQTNLHFSLAVDPSDSSVFYLGGDRQPTSLQYELKLGFAAAQNDSSILVANAFDLKTGEFLRLDAGTATEEKVIISGVPTKGAVTGRILADMVDNQTLQVLNFGGNNFSANQKVSVGGKEFGEILSVTPIPNTTLSQAVAFGNNTIVLADVTNVSAGEGLAMSDGANLTFDVVVSVDVPTKTVTLQLGLDNAFATGQTVLLGSTIVLKANLPSKWKAGESFNVADSIPVTNLTGGGGVVRAHAAGGNISFTRSDSQNTNWTARLFQGTVSQGAATYQQLTDLYASAGGNNGMTGTAPHADSRSLTIYTTGSGANMKRYLVETDDGGIYRLNTLAAATNARKWESLNGNLDLIEVNSVAYDPVNAIIFTGTQDNGSLQQTTAANNIIPTWQTIAQGDGSGQVVAVIPVTRPDGTESYDVWRFSMGNNFTALTRSEYDPTNTNVTGLANGKATLMLASSSGAGWLSGLAAPDSSFKQFFQIPLVVNAVDPTRLLTGFHGIYCSVSSIGYTCSTKKRPHQPRVSFNLQQVFFHTLT
ncbi:MAG: hypothetical protein ACYDH9_23450, partial [Limisphaerales bacterium]